MQENVTRKNFKQESPTRKRQAQHRADRILNTALEIFCEKGLDETSIEDIALRAQVGPATIYRYFDNKAELAIQSGIAYWEKVSEKYIYLLEEKAFQASSGYDQIRKIFDIFERIFDEEYLFMKFLLEFDIFVQKYHISQEKLASYENGILNLKPYVTNALEKGLRDHTLCFSWSVDEVYFSITHAMLSLMQKLAAHGNLLHSDERVKCILQIRITKELLLRGLKQEVEKS